MSFKKLEFVFPQTGLYFVGGDVEGREISNSNGAGKSAAICEVLSFGLYGKTIRNIVDKNDVVNWKVDKNCAVHVIVEDKGSSYDIVRFRKDEEHGNGLFLLKGDKDLTEGDARTTQQRIDSILGMNFLVFSTAIVFGEMAQRFADAQPAEKNQIFDEILLLHKFLDSQQAVKVDLRDLVVKEQELSHEVDKADEGLNVLKEQLSAVTFRMEEFEKLAADIEATTKEDKEGCQQIEKKLAKAEISLKKAKTAVTELEAENATIFAYLEKTSADRDAGLKALKEKMNSMKVKLDVTTDGLDKIQAWFKRPNKQEVGSRCLACGQQITSKSIEAVTAHYNEERIRLNNKRKRWQDKYNLAVKYYQTDEEDWQKKIDKAATTKSDLDEAVGEQKEVVQEAAVEIAELKGQAAALKEKISGAETKLKETREQLQKEKKQIKEKTKAYKVTIDEAKKELAELSIESKYLKFWVDGFGNQGIKSLLLDEILPALNNRVAFYAATLLDSSIRIVFDTEAVLKGGGTRDKFNVKLFKSDGRQTDYKSYSSGEKGRIDSAILLALQSLIFERAGSCSNIVIFDEVFEHLDIVGIERAVNLLSEEAKDKAIFVVSHHNEFQDYFDNFVTIKKRKGVSILEA